MKTSIVLGNPFEAPTPAPPVKNLGDALVDLAEAGKAALRQVAGTKPATPEERAVFVRIECICADLLHSLFTLLP